MNICLHVLYHHWIELSQIVFFISFILNPWMFKSFLSGKSYICRSFKQLVDNIFCIIWNLVPHFIFHLKLPMEHIIYDIFVLFSAKWRFTTKHNIHDNSNRPYITLCCITPFEDFRCNIIWSTIGFIHYFIWNYPFCQSEID